MSAAEKLEPEIEVQTIGPQPGRDGGIGPQGKFLATPADIAILGGAYGGGKTFAGAVLDHARWAHVRGYRGIVFRKIGGDTLTQIWDETEKVFPLLGGIARRTKDKGRWRFPSGARVQISDLAKLETHRGPRYTVVTFEELTQFLEKEFWFLFGRLGSTCGVRPYMRATTNPQAEGWVRDLLAWWIDPETGFPIPERDGVLRWFVRKSDGTLDWGNTREEVLARNPRKTPISLTFIRATLADNPILDAADPDYRAKLEALPAAERAAALEGNWNARDAAGDYFKKEWFVPSERPPGRVRRKVRAWDLAATSPSKENPDPDFTRGTLWYECEGPDGQPIYWLGDLRWIRSGPGEVQALVKRTAIDDGKDVEVGLFQDPAQAGKAQAYSFVGVLTGYQTQFIRANENKITFAKVWSPLVKHQRVYYRPGMDDLPSFFSEAHLFPVGQHMDWIDSGSCAFQVFTGSTPVRSITIKGL